MIKGLIFDLDGVITETAHLHYLAWKNEVAKIGINFLEKDNNKIKGLDRRKTLIAILEIYQKKVTPQIFEIMLESKNQYYVQLLENSLDQNYILPGIKELIKDAKARGLKLAIASSSHNASLILKKLKLDKAFDFIVDPKNVVNGKPDPEIFLKAMQGINLKSDQVIGFEDSLVGVIGLKAGKIKTVAITHNSLEDFSQADLIVEKTIDLNLDQILKL